MKIIYLREKLLFKILGVYLFLNEIYIQILAII